MKKDRHNRIEIHKIQDEDTEKPEEDAQITTSDIEPEKDMNTQHVRPVFVIANNMTHPPTPGPGAGGNSQSDRLAALGLTPSKKHKAQSSLTKSPRSTKGK